MSARPIRFPPPPPGSRKRRTRCVDCGVDTIDTDHFYMVTSEVWAASGLGPNDGQLCLRCLERRIGPALAAEDFGLVNPKARFFWGQDRMFPRVSWRGLPASARGAPESPCEGLSYGEWLDVEEGKRAADQRRRDKARAESVWAAPWSVRFAAPARAREAAGDGEGARHE